MPEEAYAWLTSANLSDNRAGEETHCREILAKLEETLGWEDRRRAMLTQQPEIYRRWLSQN